MVKDNEMLDYINKAKKIYSKNNENVIGYITKYGDGSSKIRLHVCNPAGDISAPIELRISEIGTDIKKLVNYMYLDCTEIRKIRTQIAVSLPDFPVIRCYKNIGYQRDKGENIILYNGARCYDTEGREVMKDVFASLPRCSGDFKEVVAQINPYMKENVKRQIVLLHALSGAICGLVKRNIILALIGESSKGKTTAMKMGASFFGQPDCEKIALKWSATQNALVKRMDGLSGVTVLIDDTQLSKLNSFQNIIYSFEGGESFDRLEKGSKLGEKCHWYVSIGITAERSLVDTFQDKGAIGRIIEMTIQDNDLFNDAEEVDDIKKLYNDHYGVVGTEFIRKILEKHNESEIKKMVEKEGKEAVEKYKGNVVGDTVLARHLKGDIAIMTATAKLANEYLGFEFQVSSIQSALLEVCTENGRTFEQNKLGEQNITEIYKDMLVSAKKQYPQYMKNGIIIIPSPLMKDCLNKYISKFKVKAAWIKEKLAIHGYLVEHNGVYCKSHTIDGKSMNGYELIVKED